MFQINLVPEVQEKKQKVSQLNYLTTVISLSILGGVVIVLVIIGGLLLTNKAMISSTEKNIAEVNAELEEYKELEKIVLSLENGLAGAKKILDGNNAWTKLLPHIEKATPTDIKFTKLSLESGKISASLEGRDINSLARFVDSFKNYEIYSLTGVGTANEKMFISLDNGEKVEVVVKTNGSWVYPISFDSATNHEVKIYDSEDALVETIKYDSENKELKSDKSSVGTLNKKLFSSIEVSQYRKTGTTINFDASMSFDGAMIW